MTHLAGPDVNPPMPCFFPPENKSRDNVSLFSGCSLAVGYTPNIRVQRAHCLCFSGMTFLWSGSVSHCPPLLLTSPRYCFVVVVVVLFRFQQKALLLLLLLLLVRERLGAFSLDSSAQHELRGSARRDPGSIFRSADWEMERRVTR